MTSNLQAKALDCLLLASCPPMSDTRAKLRQALECHWGEKVLYTKMAELTNKGYVDYGTSPSSAWLTEKGRKALADQADDVCTVSIYESSAMPAH